MQHDRYRYLCSKANSGEDAFVRHPDSNEEGLLTSCILRSDHMVVKTAQGDVRCWDYRECEDLQRPKLGPLI